MEDSKKVSIIMALYNNEKFVYEAITSVLRQTYKNIELIIVDDKSTDKSLEIAKSFNDDRIIVMENEENKGVVFSRNRAFSIATGDYIAILDSDDIAIETRIEKEVELLNADASVLCVMGGLQYIDEFGNRLNQKYKVYNNYKYINSLLLFENSIANSTAMFRREVLDVYGIKYRNIKYGIEDYYFWVEVSAAGKIIGIDDILVEYRINPSGLSALNSNEYKKNEYFKICDKYLESRGYLFQGEDREFLCNCISGKHIISNKNEMIKLYEILSSLIDQTNKIGMDNTVEMGIACKKFFCKKMNESKLLWSIL